MSVVNTLKLCVKREKRCEGLKYTLWKIDKINGEKAEEKISIEKMLYNYSSLIKLNLY